MTVRKYIALLSLLLALISLSACSEDSLYSPSYGKEGEDAYISLKIEVPEMDNAVSRAMVPDNESSKVNDIWIGIYNTTSGERTFSGIYDCDHNNTHEKHTISDIKTKSGQSYIVAVANARTNYGVANGSGGLVRLSDLLEAATTWDEYLNISVSLTMPGDITQYTPDFPMSGIYYANSSASDPAGNDAWVEANKTSVFIPEGNAGTLPGIIHLRRLHSYVKFKLTAGNGVTLEPESWRVVNVPTISYLHEQDRNSADAPDFRNAVVAPSDVSREFVKDGSAESFDFYMLENKHVGLSSVSGYEDREREFKNSDESNTGVYASLCPSVNETQNNSATFVEIRARVLQTVNGVPRIGFAKYTIHLGYCEGNGADKARDFRHRRNTKYTYNVRIDGVDKIVVEAEKEGELKPGAEGDVLDMTGKEFNVDCHYVMCNLKLSNKDRARFEWRILSPYGNEEKDLCSYFLSDADKANLKDNPFYSWVRILPTTDEKTPAVYRSDAWYLEDMRDLAGHRPYDGNTNSEDTSDKWYTVFIDEYAYALDASGNKLDDSQWARSDWSKYVNKRDRRVWLGIDYIAISPDTESTYMKAKYCISQQSIQTCYADGSSEAVGVERRNETFGKNLAWLWDIDKSNLSKYSGRYNQWLYITQKAGNNWQNVVTASSFCEADPIYGEQGYTRMSKSTEYVTEPHSYTGSQYKPMFTHPQPSKKQLYEIITACMSRNRDLNDNGSIDPEEVRWYLPTLNVYEQIVMGAEAIETPLMDFAAVPSLVYPSGVPATKKNQYFTRFHYAASDMEYLFAEEGVSTGSFNRYNSSDSVFCYGFWEIRCVRNLGVDMKSVPTKEQNVGNMFRIDTNARIITTSGLVSTGLRAPTGSFLNEHLINDFKNRLSPAFEYAEDDCKASNTHSYIQIPWTKEKNGDYNKNGNYDTGSGYYSNWEKAIKNNGVCRYYSQKSDLSDLGTWRAPNQRELAIMRELGVFDSSPNSNIKWLSVTREFYNINKENKQRYMGVKKESNVAGEGDYYHVRCVRDVIK